MNFEIIVIVVISSILFGLISSTETVLDIRQQRREQGDDPKVYL
ncbi:MAG TPA: hypothetical protein VNA23_07400 [Anaerolineales bacterium]|nr:hypothetical protein [Anaerolineales bacterium]